MKSRGSVYCSQTCADNAAKFQDNFRPVREPGCFASLKNLIVSLVGLALLALILIYAGAKFMNIGFCQKLLKLIGL